MTEFRISQLSEYQLSPTTKAQLQGILALSFPGALEHRVYYKQLPHSRLLAHQGDALIGQIGLDHRVICIGETPLTVLGLIDVCVHPDHRNKGVGGALLDAATALAKAAPNPIDGLLLFADEHAWYESHGFALLKRPCRWFGIDEHRSLRLIERPLDDCLMLKPIHTQTWPEGEIDLLGYLF